MIITFPTTMNGWMGLSFDERESRLLEKKLNISVVGFGYIGASIGLSLADRGFSISGIDKNEILLDNLKNGFCPFEEPGLQELLDSSLEKGKLSLSSDFSSISNSDVIIMVVGTPLDDDYSPNLEYVESASEEIGKYLSRGSIVMVKSTVPPGTTTNSIGPILSKKSNLVCGEDFGLVFSPERVDEGNVIRGLTSLPIIIGGVNKQSAEVSSQFWSLCLGVETMDVSNPTAAELVKLADNLWIDLNIALANEIALVSDSIGVDAMEVISAANTLPKGQHSVNILYPSIGVGGYCLTKDPWFLDKYSSEMGLELATPRTSRTINEKMPELSVSRIRNLLSPNNGDLSNVIISILGVSFKSNTGDMRNTPAIKIANDLADLGAEIRIFDSLVCEEDFSSFHDSEICSDIESAVKGANMVAVLSPHREIVDYDLRKLNSLVSDECWFFDGRRAFNPDRVIKSGLLYSAIGGSKYE